MKEVWIWTITAIGFGIIATLGPYEDGDDGFAYLVFVIIGCAFAGFIALIMYLDNEGED